MGPFFILVVWDQEGNLVQQIGRIADLDARSAPAGRGPWMARVYPAPATK